MKLFFRLTLLLVGLAFISSCSDDDYDRAPLLEIHEKVLTFTKDAGEKSVVIDINEGDVLLSDVKGESDTEWITVTTTNEGFKVVVEANDALARRDATIDVMLQRGASKGIISVTQAPGGEVYITPSEEHVKFSYDADALDLYINSNVEWTMSLDGEYDWLTVDDSQIGKSIISLAVIDNPENIKRVANLKLSGSGKETIVPITQKGTMYYDFPLIQLGYVYEGTESERGFIYRHSYRDAYVFEMNRGSVYQRRTFVTPGNTFKSKSPIFTPIIYMLENLSGLILPSVKWTGFDSKIDPLEVLKDPVFLEHLADEGFEFAWKDDFEQIHMYWNKETQVALTCTGSQPPAISFTPNNFAFSHSKFKPNDPKNQVDAFKTFDAIPVFFDEFGATAEQIMAWEEAKGSKFLPEDSNTDIMLVFAPNPATEPDIIERIYRMDKTVSPKTLESVLLLLNNTEKALYPTGYYISFLTAAVTREYVGLMQAGGFKYLGQDNSSTLWRFENKEKSMACVTDLKYFYNEGTIPRLCMTITKK